MFIGTNIYCQQVIDLYADSVPNSKPAPNEEFSDTTKEGHFNSS
jgi:hypothetical protein